MTKPHITDLHISRTPRLSAGGSLVGESILSRCGSVYIPHYLAITVFAYFEGANGPWLRANDSNVVFW